MYWERDGDGWTRRHGSHRRGRSPATGDPRLLARGDAFARWAGKRLPTEPEWEAAAAGESRAGEPRSALLRLRPAGAYGDAPADCGAVQMLGDVWEWTSSDFTGYPGFEAFPYPEYSEVFFEDEQVRLRRGVGFPPRRDPHQLPQLGPSCPAPDLLRDPLREGRLTGCND